MIGERLKQCDQIWQNFATSGRMSKVLGYFLMVILLFSKILILLWQNVMLLGKVSVL